MDKTQAWKALFSKDPPSSVDFAKAVASLQDDDGPDADADAAMSDEERGRVGGFLVDAAVFIAANASDPRVAAWQSMVVTTAPPAAAAVSSSTPPAVQLGTSALQAARDAAAGGKKKGTAVPRLVVASPALPVTPRQPVQPAPRATPGPPSIRPTPPSPPQPIPPPQLVQSVRKTIAQRSEEHVRKVQPSGQQRAALSALYYANVYLLLLEAFNDLRFSNLTQRRIAGKRILACIKFNKGLAQGTDGIQGTHALALIDALKARQDEAAPDFFFETYKPL